MRIFWSYVVAAVLAFALGWFAHRPDSAPVVAAHTAVEQAKRAAATLDTIVIRDTVRVRYWTTHYDTLRDTLNVHDTVQVRQFVQVADSTIASCSLALSDCLRAGIARDTVIATQDREIAALHTLIPSRTEHAINTGARLVSAAAIAYTALHLFHP